MNLKICSKCGKRIALKNFYLRKSGLRSGSYYEKCKDCMKSRGRLYYHQNRKRQLKLAILRRNKYRDIMRVYINKIKDVPCMDCGNKFPPCAMDFDHRVKKDKEIDVGRMINGGWSKEKVDKEVKKCDIVCSNCHRIRTYLKSAEIAKVVKALV